MKAWLLTLLLAPVAGYYLVVAFAPGWLSSAPWGIPLSLMAALGLIWLGFVITLVYVIHANRTAGPHE